METNILYNKLLETLSFYEAMSIELIYIDLDKEFVMSNPELTLDDLHSTLAILVKDKKVKTFKEDGQVKWQRIFPKKSLWQRLRKYIFS